MNCTTVHSAFYRSSITTPSGASPTRCSITTPHTPTLNVSSARFCSMLKERGLELKGITTDGSNLYPQPISSVFGDVPHQLCEFHVIKELTKAVLRAVAKIRKELAGTKPKLGRGRPSTSAARKASQRRKRIDQKIGDLFEHRHHFVRHDLTRTQRRTIHRITRGRPELRTLRDIMDEVYRLFDRRCRTDTALEKLAKLRRRVRRFKKVGKTLQKLFSPNLEKSLTFLDDKTPAINLQCCGTRPTVVTAKCKRQSTAFGLNQISMGGLPWTCSVRSEPNSARKPPRCCTLLDHERPPNRL